MNNEIIDEKSVYRDEVLYSKRNFNKENAKELLHIIKTVFDANNIHFLLNFGTLLGAVREHDFIGHDVDIDLSLHEKYKQSFYKVLPVLNEKGILLCGHFKDRFFTLFYKGIICDFDVVFEPCFPYSVRYYKVLEKLYPKFYTQKTEYIDFLGEQYEIPKEPERFLAYMYGNDWTIPQKGKQARLFPHWMILSKAYYRFKQFVRYHIKYDAL